MSSPLGPGLTLWLPSLRLGAPDAGTGAEQRPLFAAVLLPIDSVLEAVGAALCRALALLDCRLRALLCTGSAAADVVLRAGLGAAALSLCTVLPLASAMLGTAVALQVGRAVAVLEGTAPIEAPWRPAWRADRADALVTGTALARVGASSTGVTVAAGLLGPARWHCCCCSCRLG